MKQQPREVPVSKPSAVQSYVPKVLLRQEDRGGQRRWLPNERKPGTSKHTALNQQQDIMEIRVDRNEYCSDTDVEKLNALEDEVAILEDEMDKFIQEFYVAAAMFSTQTMAQKALLDRLKRV